MGMYSGYESDKYYDPFDDDYYDEWRNKAFDEEEDDEEERACNEYWNSGGKGCVSTKASSEKWSLLGFILFVTVIVVVGYVCAAFMGELLATIIIIALAIFIGNIF